PRFSGRVAGLPAARGRRYAGRRDGADVSTAPGPPVLPCHRSHAPSTTSDVDAQDLLIPPDELSPATAPTRSSAGFADATSAWGRFGSGGEASSGPPRVFPPTGSGDSPDCRVPPPPPTLLMNPF